jgi:malonyl-CoA decarboxylase
MNTSFFGEMLNSITERGRALLDRTRDRRGNAAAHSESLAELCELLLTGRGEASGVALAEEILDKYDELTTGPRIAFFEALANRSAPTTPARRRHRRWQAAPSDKTAAKFIPPPRRAARALRRLNLAGRHRRAGAHARAVLVRSITARISGGRCRFRSSVLVVVQSRLLVLRRIDW